MFYKMNCPFCDDKDGKFAIHTENGGYKCLHENKCGVSGSFRDFQIRLGDEVKRSVSDFIIPPPVKNYTIPKVHGNKLGAKILDYFKQRGLSEKTLVDNHIGQKDENTIMFPYISNGKLLSVKYRSILEKKFWSEKDTQPSLFGKDMVKNNTQLIICEGEIDMLSLYQYDINAVSIPSGASDDRWIETEWDFIDKFQTIYLCYDNDSAGQVAARRVCKRLGDYRCKTVVLPKKDANECLVGGLASSEIIQCFESAKEYAPESLRSADFFANEVVELVEHPELLYGVKTPWNKLTEILKGWRDSEVTIFSGTNGSGKTTALNQIALHAITDNKKRVCICSLEMPVPRLLRWMLQQYVEYGYLNEKVIRDSLKGFRNDLFFLDTLSGMTENVLIDVFTYCAKRYGVNFFIIDSLMRLEFPYRNEYAEQTKFISNLASFAKEFKSHVLLVAHPRKGQTDAVTPDKVDVAGSGNLTNLAHNVLVLWRINEEAKIKAEEKDEKMPDAKLYVKKNREHGTEGHVKLTFNQETKLFKEM